MAELAEKFDPIKEGLEGMPFFKRIAFKQNQISVDDETGKKNKMIDAREIVAIISMFNISLYDALHHPTQAYSSKAKMLDMYLKNPEEYREYVNIMPDIFDLYDAVEMEFADAYNAGGGRYGRKKYAGYKDGKIVAKSKFGLNKMQYKVPDGLLYPVVAAFRSLLVKNKVTGKYEWKNGVGPIDVWDNNKEDLVNKIMNFAASIGDNPNAVGKDSNIWDLAYMTIMLRNVGKSIVWFDTSANKKKSQKRTKGGSYINEEEKRIILEILDDLKSTGELKGLDIGIITGYSGQKELLRKSIKATGLDKIASKIDINTLDAFQGRENDIIIYSTVRTRDSIGFQKEKERVNVAFSRAKKLLIVCGDKNFFYNFDDQDNKFVEIIDYISEEEECEIIQCDGGKLFERESNS